LIPKLSIIVPVYNVEQYLHKCIESILAQTFSDYELILVNDGSKDKSGEICDEYLKKDSRVKVIHKKNNGLASARNTGIIQARGTYVGFIDSDDWIEDDMYKNLYESCEKTNADISIIGVREVDEKGNSLNVYIPNDINLREILKKAYAWNKIFKKQLFFDHNLFFKEGKYYEDIELIPKLFVKSNQVTTVRKVGYNYLKRNTSITGGRDEKILDNLWAYTQVKKYLLDNNLYLEYKEEFEKGVSYFKRYYINILFDYPTTFLLKNSSRIINDFEKIGGIEKIDYLKLLIKHLNFLLRKSVHSIKNSGNAHLKGPKI
jgi:glycosyltransferase involved in cell wall biosynthesis